MTILFPILLMVVCEFCKSKDIVKAGFRYNKSGKKQRHKCKKCKRQFIEDDGFKKMKNRPEIIAEACSCYKRGMSLNDTKEHLQEYRDTKISRKGILMWIRKYSRILKKFSDKQVPKIKGPIHMDEFERKLKKTNFSDG
jgi:transposase-like protein